VAGQTDRVGQADRADRADRVDRADRADQTTQVDWVQRSLRASCSRDISELVFVVAALNLQGVRMGEPFPMPQAIFRLSSLLRPMFDPTFLE